MKTKTTKQFHKGLTELFASIGLKPSHRELVRAFLDASDGSSRLEISKSELSVRIFKASDASSEAKVQYALKKFFEWQAKNGVTFIRLVTNGRQERTAKGAFTYSKPVYEFVMLKPLVTAMATDEYDDLEEIFRTMFDELESGKPSQLVKPFRRPEWKLRQAKKTILTKIVKVFENADEAGLLPLVQCNQVLAEARRKVEELYQTREEKKNRELFIKQFEAKLMGAQTA